MKTDFEIGDVIVDGYKTVGIVIEKLAKIALAHDFAKDGYPLKQWFDMQADQRLRDHAEEAWLNILPLTGGAAYAPEALCQKLRKATPEDIDTAMNNANGYGQVALKEIFKKS